MILVIELPDVLLEQFEEHLGVAFLNAKACRAFLVLPITIAPKTLP